MGEKGAARAGTCVHGGRAHTGNTGVRGHWGRTEGVHVVPGHALGCTRVHTHVAQGMSVPVRVNVCWSGWGGSVVGLTQDGVQRVQVLACWKHSCLVPPVSAPRARVSGVWGLQLWEGRSQTPGDPCTKEMCIPVKQRSLGGFPQHHFST